MQGTMEELQRTKRKRSSSAGESPVPGAVQVSDSNVDTIFPILLAALSASASASFNHKSLIKKCLNNLRLFLLSGTHQSLPASILPLLPLLLTSKSAAIASRTAECVGMASLSSFEANQQIALDSQILKVLISVAGRLKKRSVAIDACHAIMDVATTPLGRRRLLELSALESLIIRSLQVSKSSISRGSLSIVDNGDGTFGTIGFKEDELLVLLLNAAIILINTCSIDDVDKIPKELAKTFLVFMKKLWVKVHNQMLHGGSSRCSQEEFYLSNIRVSNMAESIFRLSASVGQLGTPLTFEVIRGSIFGPTESSFENFMLKHWELSPFLMSRTSYLKKEDDIFSSFVESINSKGRVPSLISAILENLISCLPIASDELDILNFLKEVRNELGCPIVYQQDIRVVKTDRHLNKEVHFFQPTPYSCSIQVPHVLYINDILKCEEAYRKGYTIALRGMEFRFGSIADIADGLASMFGQPSVGANIYLTPPNSQGLARHYDDHCVFVCQLFGTKQWTVSSHPNVQLPRLYEPLADLHALDVDNSVAESRQYILREGDILYIPRGFAHEACTENSRPCGSAGFSLHLTLGIEVEPPFEWEGFLHIALYCWNQTQKQNKYASFKSSNEILNLMSVSVLHLVFGLIGCSKPTFRKACLVAASSFPSRIQGFHDLNQETIFSHLIDKVQTESRFLEAVRSIGIAIKKKQDPFQRMRWLQLFMNQGGEAMEGIDLDPSFMRIEDVFALCAEDIEKAEAVFIEVKSRFCAEVLFGDVMEIYKMFLEKFKKTRKQYMNGMLSLHGN